MTLYEIKAEILAILEMAEDPDADTQTIKDTMESVEADFEEKADGYAKEISQLKYEANALKAEKSRITDRIAGKERAIERLQKALGDSMVETGKTKFKTPLFSYWIQKNPASVRLIEGKKIPERFLIAQPPKVDTAGILKALKAGETFDFAEKAQGEGVRFR